MDPTMEDIITNTTRHGQVQVQFITSDSTIELEEGKRQLLVPTNIGRYGISQILNSESMLDTGAPIPFDILVNGAFLRTTLEEYLTANGLSSETTIELQYVRSLIPPLYEASFEHDDWVSCVDVLSATSRAGSWDGHGVTVGQERLLSGSYDGLLRIWNKSGQTIATSASSSTGGHSSSIKSAKYISPSQIASAGLDRTIRIWKYTEAEDQLSATLKPTLELYGHKGGIESIDVWGPSNQILSGSTDGKIGLWTTLKNSAPEANASLISSGPTAKRRKLTTSTSTTQRGPLSLIASHSGPVNAVIFNPLDHTVAYSASQDHTIRTFDLTTSSLVDTRTTSHPLLSLTALPGISHQILAAGTSARHITLLDPRISSQSTQVMTLRGHTNKIVSLGQDPESRYGLVSGSHDGTCRIWDLRSSRQGTKDEGGGQVGEAVYVVERESHKGVKRPVGGDGIKVFGVAWDENVGIVSGGEDKMLQINRGRGITKPAES
ncbi:probable Ribosome biogenesis protein ytm1 [Rhynchosporium graminicola]|uniref:Ribosome biogenesis protein YTM1 n=1 Tax=Rhynchosporium graminicola TaxID=2792576 RepID=A0A1E1LBT9_9HELO|nr:probable Ribosome biogenesis protein ytm1 [Rhynchosporium commune]